MQSNKNTHCLITADNKIQPALTFFNGLNWNHDFANFISMGASIQAPVDWTVHVPTTYIFMGKYEKYWPYILSYLELCGAKVHRAFHHHTSIILK